MSVSWHVGISDGAINVIRGPGIVEGACFDGAVTTTATSFTLTPWNGRLVAVTITGAAFYRWATATSATLDTTTERTNASAAVNLDIAGRLPEGRHTLTVPKVDGGSDAVFLRIAATTGTIDVRVELVS